MPFCSTSFSRAVVGCALTPLALCLSQAVWAQASPAAADSGKSLSAVTVIGSVDQLQSLDFYAPNSSAVIDRNGIDAIGSRKLDQALQYQAGIVSEPFGADNKVEWFKIRGFDASVSIDGAPTTPNGFFVGKPEIFGVESVEVVKGSNSLVFGAVNTGGVVNLVTKRPQKTPGLLLSTEVGNRGKLGLGVDYNGVANSDGSVYYRLVAQARQEDGLQRGTEMDSYYFAPSVTVEFSKRTALTLLASVQRESGTPTNGFMPGYGSLIDTPYGRIDRRTNLGEPDFDRLKRSQATAGWLLRHALSDDWTFAQNYKFSRLNLDQQNVFAYASDNNRQALRGYSYTKGDASNHYLDNRLSGSMKWGDITLRPTLGLDYLRSSTEGQNNGFGLVPNLDMFAPVYGAPFSVTSSPYDQSLRQLGAYASAQLQVGSNWNFNAGVRHDRAKSTTLAGGYDENHNSFNAGVMYITPLGIAPYASYAESFKPTVGVDGNNRPYVPYEGRQAELGVKLEPSWLHGGTMTFAYFDLQEKNALAADASNVQRQIGKRTNRGFEWQGDFKIMPATAIKASYTHNDSEQDLSATQTVRTPLIPRHQASLWVSHRLTMAGDQGLTLAAGARHNGSTVDEAYYPGRKIASFTLLDLMVRYEIDRNWALQLNARNLTDKTYVSACDFYCYYGGGRTVDVQLQYRR